MRVVGISQINSESCATGDGGHCECSEDGESTVLIRQEPPHKTGSCCIVTVGLIVIEP